MNDAGEKMSDSDMQVESSSKNEKYYPHLDFSSKQLPEIKKWNVGKKYTLVIEVKATRKSINEKEGNEAKEEMCFEVLKVGVKSNKMSNDEKTDKMVEKMYDKEEDKE